MKSVALFFLFTLLITAGFAQSETPKTSGKETKDKDDPRVVWPARVRGPYLQKATPQSIMIRWRTDALCRSRVYFGISPDKLDQLVTDSALVTEHKVSIRNLQPATRYFYSIGDVKFKLQGDTGNYFYSLPARGDTGTWR